MDRSPGVIWWVQRRQRALYPARSRAQQRTTWDQSRRSDRRRLLGAARRREAFVEGTFRGEGIRSSRRFTARRKRKIAIGRGVRRFRAGFARELWNSKTITEIAKLNRFLHQWFRGKLRDFSLSLRTKSKLLCFSLQDAQAADMLREEEARRTRKRNATESVVILRRCRTAS